MKARDVRNKIVKGLNRYMQIPVCRPGQVSPEEKPPYIVYSVISPYMKGNTLGHYGCGVDGSGQVMELRAEQAGMSLSFTACGRNRTLENGEYVFGEDEAMELAEKAQGWFLHAGRDFLSPDVVVASVENVASRSVLMVDEEANRYGFDVTVNYIREDARRMDAVAMVTSRGENME